MATKKTPKRSPTLRQKKVIELIVENPWRTKGEILKEAGYSHATQIKPHEVFESKAIQDFFTADGTWLQNLKQKHNQLLNSAEMRRYTMPIQMEDEEIKNFFENEYAWCKVIRIIAEDDKKAYRPEKIVIVRIPNEKTQLAALDMAYKIIGLYKDPSAWTPPPTPSQTDEKTQRISRAEQIFQLWTWKN